jgi:hypothetical protein
MLTPPTVYAYARSGLSVIPISTASKRPLGALLPRICDFPRRIDPRTKALTTGNGHGSWLAMQYTIVTRAEQTSWFTAHGLQHARRAAERLWKEEPPRSDDARAAVLAEPVGVAVATGAASGGLLVLDFDGAGFYERWRERVGALPADVFVQRTGGGGYQVWVRCDHPGRNTKLAWAVTTDDHGQPKRDERNRVIGKVAIETRGDAGYAVLAPSLHPSGRRYETLQGDPTQLPHVGMDVVTAWLTAARALDEMPAPPAPAPTTTRESTYRPALNGTGNVIDAFNEAVPITEALEEARYTLAPHGPYAGRYIRPNSKSGNPSVVVREGRSYHHSSSDALSDGYWHTAFDVYCQTQHHGDVKEAVKAAARRLNIPLPPREPTHATPTIWLTPAAPDTADTADSPPPLPFRGVQRDVPAKAQRPVLTGDRDAQQDAMMQAIYAYLADPHPDHILLVRLVAGGGKSTVSVQIAEMLAQPDDDGRQRRIAYYGPRHTLFGDLMEAAQHRDWWHEWRPRTQGHAETGEGETCMYAPQVATWLHKGYDAMHYCARICGWDYIKNECAYHYQKRTRKPLLYLQHQHLWAGVAGELHPSLAFGDELPLGAMLWQWQIPEKWVAPPGMDLSEPASELLYTLAALCKARDTDRYTGRALLDALGGPQSVADVVADYEARRASLPESFDFPEQVEWKRGKGKRRGDLDGDDPSGVKLSLPGDVENAPYNYVRPLLWHLKREAAAALAGEDYIHRIVAGNGRLMLMQRRILHPSVPRHVIWLDGTGDAATYEALFGRPVKELRLDLPIQGTVYQVVNRANGKRSLLGDSTPDVPPVMEGEVLPATERRPELTRQAHEAFELIRLIRQRHGYQKSGLISFKGVVDQAPDPFDVLSWFYGNRGSNAFTDRGDIAGVDSLFVVGTPLPDPYALRDLAGMLHLERMAAFDLTWSDRLMPYAYQDADGNGYSYPVSNFWNEPALQVLVEQLRDMEIVQAAERARLRIRTVDVWLLLNLPLTDLPPDQIVTTQELLRGPVDLPVDPWKWSRVLALADRCWEAEETITAGLIAKECGVAAPTARRYLAYLAEQQPERWEPSALIPRGRGRPSVGMEPKRGATG